MSNGGSQKPADIQPGEEAKILLRVPEIVDLSDGSKVTVRRMKLREIMQNAPAFVSALASLSSQSTEEGEVDTDAERSGRGYKFLGSMLASTWDPLLKMLELATDRTAADYDDMDAEDMLAVVRVFIKLHKRVASAFFGVLEEAGFPVAALKAWFASLRALMTSLEVGTDSKKSET